MIRVRLLLSGAVLALVAMPAAAVAAPAHNVVLATTPTAGATLTELPDAFSVTTNEPWIEIADGAGFAIQIRDAAGGYYGDGCVEVAGTTISTEPALGEAGGYTVLWQGVSADGHTIDGEIPFTWAPAAGFEPAAAAAAPPVCGVAAPTPSTAPSDPATPEPEPGTEPETASAVDLTTVLWIGGVLIAVGVAVAIGIALASRRRT